MMRWLNRFTQLLGIPYVFKIHMPPFESRAEFAETMIHAAFQYLDDLVSCPEFCLQDYDSSIQSEIVELYWWWNSVRPYRALVAPSDLVSHNEFEARIVYMKEDSEMLERLATLRSNLAL